MKMSFAIIGGGPAGFYLARFLAKMNCKPIVHVYEKDMCPFGLLRYGVAPDHISIKKAEINLSSVASYEHFDFIGNYPIDKSQIHSLSQSYSAVIYAIGAQGTNYSHIHPNYHMINARNIVSWYNQHPDFYTTPKHLSQQNIIKHIGIIGNGNVAIDISRIFLKDYRYLVSTYINPIALDKLQQMNCNTVTLFARRGVTHSAFSLKYIRELVRHNISLYALKDEVYRSMTLASQQYFSREDLPLSRVIKRKIEFIKDKVKLVSKNYLEQVYQENTKKVILRYLANPLIFKDKTLKVKATRLEGESFAQVSIDTPQTDELAVDLLINSIGYKVTPILDSELDPSTNRIRNSYGAVTPNIYAGGWCQNGAKGVLDDTLHSCYQTFLTIVKHIYQGLLKYKPIPYINKTNTTNFTNYLYLRYYYLSRGNKYQFIRKKLTYKYLIQFFRIT